MEAIKTMTINGNFYQCHIERAPRHIFGSMTAFRDYLLGLGADHFGTEGRDFRIAQSQYKNCLIPLYIVGKNGDTIEIK